MKKNSTLLPFFQFQKLNEKRWGGGGGCSIRVCRVTGNDFFLFGLIQVLVCQRKTGRREGGMICAANGSPTEPRLLCFMGERESRGVVPVNIRLTCQRTLLRGHCLKPNDDASMHLLCALSYMLSYLRTSKILSRILFFNFQVRFRFFFYSRAFPIYIQYWHFAEKKLGSIVLKVFLIL